MKLSDLYNNKQPTAKVVRTRFRAYKLGKAGSLCSYFAGNYFTLIEATDSEISRQSLQEELEVCGKDQIDTLHITSWDQDHCEAGALDWILGTLKPTRIQTPGYTHDSSSAKTCQALIAQYKAKRQQIGKTANVIAITPQYISSLGKAEELGYQDILYHPKTIYTDSNNNSTVNFFRSGCFNVLSTGDIEHHDIGSYLRSCRTLKREIDVLLLPHHGGPVDLMTKKFLDELRPSLAVCTSNTGNQHEHPDPSIRKMLGDLGIPLMTTKRGDVLIESTGSHMSRYQASDLLSDGETSQEERVFTARKFKVMSMNGDTIRDRLGHLNTGPRGTVRR
jgi:competence protein ComEC